MQSSRAAGSFVSAMARRGEGWRRTLCGSLETRKQKYGVGRHMSARARPQGRSGDCRAAAARQEQEGKWRVARRDVRSCLCTAAGPVEKRSGRGTRGRQEQIRSDQITPNKCTSVFFSDVFTDWRPGYRGPGKSDVQVRAGDSATISGHQPLQGSPQRRLASRKRYRRLIAFLL